MRQRIRRQGGAHRPYKSPGEGGRPQRRDRELRCPGVIDTDMMAGFSEADRSALADETRWGPGHPRQVAEALLFLAGERAGYITGQVLGVNGGLVV